MKIINIYGHTMQSSMTCWLTHAESSSTALTLRKFRQKLRTEGLSQQVGLGFGGWIPFGRAWIDLFGLHRSYRIETFEIFTDPGCGWMIVETFIPRGIWMVRFLSAPSRTQKLPVANCSKLDGNTFSNRTTVCNPRCFITRCCVVDLGCVPDS